MSKRHPFHKTPAGHPIALAGDFYYTRGLSGLSKAIRWAEQSRGEGKSWANHAGIVTRAGYFVPPHPFQITPLPGGLEEVSLAFASEALWHVKHHEWWSHHGSSAGYEVAVFRVRAFDDEACREVVSDALSRTGNRYGWWRMFTFLGEKLSNAATFGKATIPFTKLHFQKQRVVCSNHQGRALSKGGFDFGGMDPAELDPDEGFDYCLAHPDEVEFVGRAIVPSRPRAVLTPAEA